MRMLVPFALLFVFPQYPDAFPPLGLIDFYGLHKVSEVQVRQTLGIHEGDTIDATQIEKLQRESEQRISAIPGVKAGFLNFGC